MNSATNYDAKAILVARSVEKIAAPDDIFLFGSRARGDWDDASDIDIFTIADAEPATKERHRRALKAGQDRALEIYGHPVKIDLVRYSPADFERFRSARTHLTYHALKDGISMNCEPAAHSGRYPEVEPDNRPDVEQRFINYQRQVLLAETVLDVGLGYEEAGHNFQRCLENAYKGSLPIWSMTTAPATPGAAPTHSPRCRWPSALCRAAGASWAMPTSRFWMNTPSTRHTKESRNRCPTSMPFWTLSKQRSAP